MYVVVCIYRFNLYSCQIIHIFLNYKNILNIHKKSIKVFLARSIFFFSKTDSLSCQGPYSIVLLLLP